MSCLRFLIFHHNGKIIDKVKKVIMEMGCDVVDVKDIRKGLKLVRSGDFGVVVIDVTMSGYDGVEVLKKVAKSGVPEWIIAITDSKGKKLALKKVLTGECTYINKPVDSRELRLLLKNISEMYYLRKEVSDKTKRISHLEVINEIARETLFTCDENTLLWNIAREIHEKLSYFNVNIFLMDEEEENTVLRAFAGGFGEDLEVGYSLKPGEGIVGWVASNHEPLLAGDVRTEPRRIKGFSFEGNVLSELAVPIIFNNRVIGVLHVESEELNAFSHDDIAVLETIADQMALELEKWRLSRELLDAYEFSATINDSLPVSIFLVDPGLQLKYVNQTFCETNNMKREDILDQPIVNCFSGDMVEKLDFTQKLNDVFNTGIPVFYRNAHQSSPSHPDKALNISFLRVKAGKHPRVMILIQDVTEYFLKTQQLSLLREISIVMQGVFERDKLLHMILTGVTAGFAMGFNRAFLFLVDKEKDMLIGSMGVGPTSRDEAYRIWDELSKKDFTLHDYIEDVNTGEMVHSDLYDLVKQMAFDLKKTRNVLTETVNTGCYMHIVNAWKHPGVDEAVKRLLAVDEFVTIPLIARNEVIGVLFADNAYSGKMITKESLDELTMFAATAALAIENADMLRVLEQKVKELEEAYIKLEETHDMLIRHEKLAAIGEVSTRLAHEIRNPLATIGGFAKSIPPRYDDRERTIRNARIIVEEVRRLENILSSVLDFTKAGTPQKTANDVNMLVKETVSIMEGDAIKNDVTIMLGLAEEKIETELDTAQIKQVLINVIQNAFNAMRDGGALEVKTSGCDEGIRIDIKDTGEGIPEEFIDNIFDPFFTTRCDGTGLGLSISQRIIQNHNGRLEIKSIEGEGTTVTIFLPTRT